MRNLKNKQLLGWVLGCVYGTWAQAQQAPANNISDPATLLGAQSSGRAGNTVASATEQDSLFQNPAGSAFAQKYAVGAGYVGVGNTMSVSVVDTKSGPLGGGMYYLRRDFETLPNTPGDIGDYARTEQRAGAGLFGRVSDTFGLGVNVKYAFRDSLDARYASGKNWNGDVGAKYILSDRFTLGFVAQNLLTDPTGMNPRNMVFGVEALVAPAFLFSLQMSKLMVNDMPSTFAWGAGAQYQFYPGVSARVGYTDDRPWKQKFLGVGLGYEGKSFGMDYAFQTPLSGGTPVHSVGLTGFL